MGIFAGDGMPAWRRWHQLICNRFGVASPESGDVIQPLAVAVPARFDSKPRELGRYLENMYADKIPQWSPMTQAPFRDSVYIPSGASLAKGYRSFLYSLTSAMVSAASPEQRAAIKEAAVEADKARELLGNFDDNTNSMWNLWRARHPTAIRSVWERDNQIPEKRRALKLDRDQTLALYMRAVADAGQADATLVAEQIVAMDDPTQQIRLPNSPSRAEEPPETWELYYRQEFVNDFAKFRDQPSVAESMAVNESVHESAYLETRWSVGGSVSFLGLFRAGGLSAEMQEIEQHLKNDTTNINVEFKGLEEFSISRGGWYDEQIIRRHMNKVPVADFWEANGALNLIPRSAIIVKGMSVTVSATAETLDRLEKHVRGGADAGFWCGWFRVGVGAGGSSDKVEINHRKGESTMTLSTPDDTCYVLALRSWRPLDMVGKPRMLSNDAKLSAIFNAEEEAVERYLGEIRARVLNRDSPRIRQW